MKRDNQQDYVQYKVYFTDLLEREYTYDVYYALDEEKYFLKIFDIIFGRKPWDEAPSGVDKYAKDFLCNMGVAIANYYKSDLEGAEKLFKEMLTLDVYADTYELIKSDLKRITDYNEKWQGNDPGVDAEKVRSAIWNTIFILEPWKHLRVKKVGKE